MAKKKEPNAKLDTEIVTDYTHFIVMPLKIVGCWDWYPKPEKEYQLIINNAYQCMVLLILTNLPISLIVNLYTEWENIMKSLDKIADGLPLIATVAIVSYYALYKQEMYDLVRYMNKNFVFHSAKGLTNMTMWDSYKTAMNFAYIYTACTLFSVSVYVGLPVIIHFWTKQPLLDWIYMDVTHPVFYVLVFLRHAAGQAFVGLALGQLGVFFAANSILLCGQLDLLCCSLRNVRYTAMLQNGIQHSSLVHEHKDIRDDEKHSYIYSKTVMEDSQYHYDKKLNNHFVGRRAIFDIYNPAYDEATESALRDCAKVCQVINNYKKKFEAFVSPLLVLRVIQVTIYLCTLLYAATLNFDMVTVEYLGAVALDIFVYCYYGNQLILQASRVSTAAYHSAWHTMGVRPRRLLLNILLANKAPVIVRAGRFLPMDLHTFVVIIKTSFSYYTLLVNVNEKK